MKVVLKKFDDINGIDKKLLSHVSMWFDGEREIDAFHVSVDVYLCQYVDNDAYVRFYIRESYILKHVDEYRIDLPEELFTL